MNPFLEPDEDRFMIILSLVLHPLPEKELRSGPNETRLGALVISFRPWVWGKRALLGAPKTIMGFDKVVLPLLNSDLLRRT